MTYVATYLLVGLGFGFLISWLASKIEDPELDREAKENKHFNMIMSMLFWPWGVYYLYKGMNHE